MQTWYSASVISRCSSVQSLPGVRSKRAWLRGSPRLTRGALRKFCSHTCSEKKAHTGRANTGKQAGTRAHLCQGQRILLGKRREMVRLLERDAWAQAALEQLENQCAFLGVVEVTRELGRDLD